ncbi:MAG: phospholipase D-like domain-containing protein [Propionibacteriales bacterium]|nr:phospholipase D-like domain-containing protein [Propionibacteriales bacterium]
MRLATTVVSVALSCALLITGAETAFAETPSPAPEPTVTSTEQANPSPTPEPSATQPEATPTADGQVQPADVPSMAVPTYRNAYCADLSQLMTPAIQKANGLPADYLGSPVALGQAPDLVGYVPKEGALFNNPFTSSSTVVIRQLLNGFRAAAAGTNVKIAMYSMSRWDAAKAVIRAHCRGVNIQYLTDDHANGTSAIQATKTVLTADATGSTYKACYLSCSSDYTWRGARVRVVTTENPLYRPYMHAKYITFDSLAGVPFVSMVSSGNFTSTQVSRGWNNIYTAVKDQTTYDFLNGRLDEMWADTSGNDYAVKTSTGSPVKTTYFFPWAVANSASSLQTVDPATDPYTSFLENVKCTGAAKGYGNSQRKTQVLVSMYQWTSSRLYLSRRLKRLKNAGCEVKVIMSASEWDLEVMPILRKYEAKKAKTTYKYGNISIRNGDRGSKFVHSKFIIVNGKWGSDTKAHYVFTGSGNWTKSSIRFNNEVNLLIKGGPAYGQFKANWNKIWGSSRYSRPITKLEAKKKSRGDA